MKKVIWLALPEEYREALRLNPKNDDAREGLGEALAGKNDWDALIAADRSALQRNPQDASAHYNLGQMLENKNDLDEAIKEYWGSSALEPAR